MIKKAGIIFLILILLMSSIVLADINPNGFKPSSGGADPELTRVGNTLVGVAQVIGTIISLATLIIIGIKLMLSAPGEKAEIKAKMVPYIIGAILVFSISNLLQILYDIMQGI